MIQLNLLPDVKIAFIKAKAQKHLVMLGSFVVGGAALTIFVLLFIYVNLVQSTHLSSLSDDIVVNSEELTGTKDLNQILTIQKQLTTIDGLHDKKPATDRLVGYIAITTPTTVSLGQYDVDFMTNAITITGKSNALSSINAYVDTLKSIQYTTKEDKEPKKAYDEVVLTNFTPGANETTFSIALKYDPIIFDSSQEVALSLPNQQATNLNSNAFGGGQ
jgi:hypothetical protein